MSGDGTPDECIGDYVMEGETHVDEDFTLVGKNNVYRIEYTSEFITSNYDIQFELIRNSDDAVMFRFTGSGYFSIPYDADITMTAINPDASGTLTFNLTEFEIYSRLLTDSETVLGLSTSELPDEDIVSYNRNYQRAIGYAIDSTLITANTQVDPTEYGLANNGEYFVEPYFLGIGKVWPIAKSTWANSSIWFENTVYEEIAEESGRKAYTFSDGAMISEVIKVLLAEIDSTLSHDGTNEYSEFLYGDTNPITGNAFRVLITQKTNITSGEYDTPAQTAPITLSDVFTMLKNTFNVYWYIEDSKLKFEHISFF